MAILQAAVVFQIWRPHLRSLRFLEMTSKSKLQCWMALWCWPAHPRMRWPTFQELRNARWWLYQWDPLTARWWECHHPNTPQLHNSQGSLPDEHMLNLFQAGWKSRVSKRASSSNIKSYSGCISTKSFKLGLVSFANIRSEKLTKANRFIFFIIFGCKNQRLCTGPGLVAP